MQSLQDRVRDAIEEAIHAGKLSPGEKLDERLYAEQFETSRTPVREALLVLAAQGLVTIMPRSGIFVTRATSAELVAMFEALAEMEGVVARLATQRMTNADKKALSDALLEGGKYAVNNDTGGYVDANERFHNVLYIAASNPYLTEQIRSLRRRLALYWRNRGLISANRVASSHDEHDDVVRAVLSGNPDAAAAAMRAHITAGGQAVTDLVLQARSHE